MTLKASSWGLMISQSSLWTWEKRYSRTEKNANQAHSKRNNLLKLRRYNRHSRLFDTPRRETTPQVAVRCCVHPFICHLRCPSQTLNHVQARLLPGGADSLQEVSGRHAYQREVPRVRHPTEKHIHLKCIR